MTFITFQNGTVVMRDDKVGTGGECCCEDGPLGTCCGWICDYVAEIIWPDIENPEDVPAIDTPPGWILMPDGVPGIGQYRKTINGEENCNDPESVAAQVTSLQAELDAIVAGQGGFSQVSFDPDASGQGCLPVEVTEQTCSGTYAGVWYATQQECFDNCPNPLP